MAGRDLKLTATLNDQVSKGIDALGNRLQSLTRILETEGQKVNQKSAAQADQRVAKVKAVNTQIARLEYDLSRAQADAITDRWKRLRAIEDANYKLRLARFKGNDEAIEIENKRHKAKLEAITAQQGNFPNTPFQQLLTRIGGLADKVGIPPAVTASVAKFAEAVQGVGAEAAVMAGGEAAVAGGAMSLLGPLAAAAGGALALGTSLKFAYTQAREQMDADKRLAAVLRSTGGAAGLTMDDLQGMAGALQDVTDFSDDAAQGAEAVLLQYDAIGKDIFPRALKASSDLAATTGNLSGAAEQLGRALQRPQDASRELRTMGILLSDTQKKQLELWVSAGDKARAQAFILDEVARKWGGQAESMSHATTKLGHQIGELAETIGTPFVKAVDSAAGAILRFFKASEAKKAFDAKLLAGDFQNFGEGAAKATGKVAAFQQQLEETYRKSHPQAAKPVELDDDQKEKLLQMNFDLERARTELIQNESDKRVAQENIDFQKRLHELGGFTQAVELETKAHNARLAAINAEAAEAALQDQANGSIQVFKTKMKLEYEAAARLRADRDKAVEEDEKRTLQIFDARDRLAEASGRTDLDRLAAKQAKELELYKAGSEARKIIEQAQAKERERFRREELQAEIAAGATLLNNIGGAMQALAGKNKALAKTGLRITEAGAIANTAGGIMKAFDQGGVLGFLTGAAIAAEGVKQVATIEAQIGKFATGTDYAPGGMALVGERGPEMMYVPRGAQIKTAAETSRMMGSTLNAPITIHMAPGSSRADAKAVADAVDVRLRALAKDLKEIEYRGIRA